MTTAQQTQRPTSAELDAADPLAAQREAFYTPDAGQLTSYLDGNSLGLACHASPQYGGAVVYSAEAF